MDHRSLIFASVFPVPSLSHTTPTPIVTPDLGFSAPGKSFGSPFSSNASGQHRAVKRNLAWSTATRFLSLPKSSLDADTSFDAQLAERSADVHEALEYLLLGEGQSEDGHEEGLVEWYTNETSLHFAQVVKPTLSALWNERIELSKAWGILEETQRILEQAQGLYIQPFAVHILPFLQRITTSASTIRPSGSSGPVKQTEADVAKYRFHRDIHAVFAHCLPVQRFSKTLSYTLYDAGCTIFSLYIRQDNGPYRDSLESSAICRQRMIALLLGLNRVGLGGATAQKAFAHAMDQLLDSFIVSHYNKVDWFAKKSVVPLMRVFIENGLCPLVELVMECLRFDGRSETPQAEVETYQDMALGRLGRARVDTLFDFITNFDESMGAVRDAKEYLRLAGAKQHLSSSFAQQVSRRLLHPGATTTYILNVYISIIRAFHVLEPKGVLLERVARPIRRYLKEREDTARIIITSLLTDVGDEKGRKILSGGELSYEIASEMGRPFASYNQEMDEELNWGDLSWQPLPSDASPDYKKSKVEDVIWFLLTLWEREDFINELKNILGDHLLRCQDPEYEKEIRLLELIKLRLGDDKLQACEVMLRDVLESKRINGVIRASGEVVSLRTPDQRVPHTPEHTAPRTPRPRRGTASAQPTLLPSTPRLKLPEATALNSQIVSSFFWPPLRDDHFLVPAQIQSLQKEYESRFERIQGMRKLRWMNALGESAVTLELEDRTEEFDKLTPWQVSIIYAFQPRPGEECANSKVKGKAKTKEKESTNVTRNVRQLEEMLEMDESLVRQSLSFWVGKSVLRETSPDTYEVIEKKTAATVDDSDAAAKAQEIAQVQAESQAGAVRSHADLLAEKKEVYIAFVMGMLTNQGNMPLQRILMMMRMMVQGGFPFGVDELRGLLKEMEGGGKVVCLGGDVYGVGK